jgi:hypothetical protein
VPKPFPSEHVFAALLLNPDVEKIEGGSSAGLTRQQLAPEQVDLNDKAIFKNQFRGKSS